MENIIKCINHQYGIKCRIIEEFSTGNYGITLKVDLDSENHVLKIIPKEENPSINQILPFLHWINRQGVIVPHPLKTREGQWYCETVHDEKPVLCYLYPLLDGDNVENSVEDYISGGMLRELGRDVARLHQAMNSYSREKLQGLKSWNKGEGLFVIYEEVHPHIPKEIGQAYEHSRDELSALNLPMDQVVHSDLHMANILYQQESSQFKFIDLEDCVLGHRVMDLAVLCFDLPVICPSSDLCLRGIADLFEGYQSLIPLEEKEMKALPPLLKMLETASYINCYAYREEQDPWLQRFYMGREEKILEKLNYLNFPAFALEKAE